MALGAGRGTIPQFEEFNNTTTSHQPYVKISSQLNANHQLSGYWQRDRLTRTGNREYHYEPVLISATGGDLFGGKLSSIFGTNTTAQFTFLYNDKSGSDDTTLEQLPGTGPAIVVHETAFERRGRLTGTGRLVEGGNLDDASTRPSSMMIFRGDLTHYKEGWGGAHEFQTGIFAAPRFRYERFTNYLNDGFVLEEHRLVDPNNPSAGTIPFHQRFREPAQVKTLDASDRDIGIYFQDSWKPHPRLTLNLGLRADWVRRFDNIFDITRMDNALALGPRFGFSYLVTEDARNVLRGSWVRVHEQVNGRDFGTSLGPSSRASTLDVYDFNGDGVFETEFFRPQTTATVAAAEFDPNLHQPFVDEWIIGFRKQFPRQLAVDVAWVNRRFKDRYGQVDVNGFYPDAPGQPFGGFGRIDPTRGRILQLTNNDWDELVYNALEITVTQRLARNFQFMAGINRQWQHFSGTWNPTDPAGFIQPDAYPSNRLIYPSRGLRDDDSLDLGTTSTYGPMWRKYSIRLGGTWFAPGGIILAASFTQLAGPWSGPILTRISAIDPDVTRFGPSSFALEDGGRASNPLATNIRFKFPTRGEGQVQADALRALGLKIGKVFRLAGTHEFEIGASIFNVFNSGGFYQYTYNGANQEFNPNFLEKRNLQPPRGLQMTFLYRF